MTKLFEIINRICRKRPALFIGGFWLAGLCFGTQSFSETVEHQHQSNIAPLYGQGVMFFDEENKVVRKVDAFVFDPSHPASFDNLCEFSGTEPKKLQFRVPDIAGNDTIMKMVEQANKTFSSSANEANTKTETHYPTRLVSNDVPTDVNDNTKSIADQARQADDTLKIAMRRPETNTGEQYAAQQQLPQHNAWGRQGRFTITPYGFINVSTSWESERTYRGDFAMYSLSPELDGGGHSGFHIDPKSSRLGIKVDGPELPIWCRCVKTSALAEIDFQAANYAGTRNRGSVMMRRAFVDFTHDDTRLLIGQEWDVVSPLVPQSLNYVPGSYTGNVGYRRAQIRLERTQKWDSDFSTQWQIAVCDNVSSDYLIDPNVNTANSGWPMLQGRIATTFGHNPRANCQPVTVGISGHIGEMTHDYHRNNTIDRRRHETWSANLDIEVPVTNRLHFTTELYTGTNLSPLLAGIGQGVDLFSPNGAFNPRSADAYGGWINLNFKATKKFQINSGYCTERMDDMIGSTPMDDNEYSARDKNRMLYINGMYNWTVDFLTGLEVSRWRTDWHIYNAQTNAIRNLEPGETTRIDFLMRYSF